LNQDNWDLTRFNKNGVIGYQHKVYGGWDDTDNPDNVIGKGFAYIEDKKLMVDITFEPAEINPLAEKIFQKILFGSLRAVSVGFLPIGQGRFGEGQDSNTYYFAGQELLEVSVVNIPANPNALKKSLEAESEYLEAERKRLRAEAEAEVEEVQPEPLEEETRDICDADIDVTLTMARAALRNNNL
jgi:HK97 family phage prohead protease